MDDDSPAIGRQELLRLVASLHPDAVNVVNQAVDFAMAAHGDQQRADGSPYVSHPIETATILADLRMDVSTILGGVLHDVLEDTAVPPDEMEQLFGPDVLRLVQGVTKLRRVKRKSKVEQEDLDEEQAENLRKMVLAMVDDIRVVIIKLADRLHNMRTLGYLPEDKQVRKARETLDVFAPIASRLGIWQLKWQLEDLSFRYLDPAKYHEIATLLVDRRIERAAYLERVVTMLREKLLAEGIHVRITGRPKHIYSIYRKMEEKGREFDQIYDAQGVRIIGSAVRECYHALGLVHSLWRPIPGEFDDYIAMPKDNGYQSLHTAVIALDGKPLEVQIRTEEMHRVAEYGIAAHWRYKEGAPRDADLELRIQWLRQATEWREDVDNAQQFVDSLKSDVFAESVFVFTPKGDIVDLPRGATPVDFAYHIHSEIGNRCRGARVDNRLVSLDYQLHNGEQVEIITAKQGGPSRDWLNPHLNYVATQRARGKIRAWFRRQEREANISDGRDILERELKRLGFAEESFTEIATLFKYSRLEDFLDAVGYGEVSPSQIASKIDSAAGKHEQLRLKAIPEAAVSDIQVMGVGDLLTKLGTCCKPVPGDKIVGYITRGKGITVHRSDCPNVINLRDIERLVPVTWGRAQQEYPIVIRIEAFDRSGLLRDIAAVVADLSLNMSSANVRTNDDHTATISVTVGVKSVSQLAAILNRFNAVRDVLDAHREGTG
jgi:GTP pyrophosphokinase